MRKELRIGFVVAGIVVAAILVAGLRLPAQANDSDPKTAAFHLEASADSVEAPEGLTVEQGQKVQLHVTLDFESPVHLHGYDITRVTRPDGPPAVIEFVADVPGRFELEAHTAKRLLAVLEVRP